MDLRLELKNPFARFEIGNLDHTIPSLFEKTVEKYPDRIAVCSRSEEIRYRDLNAMADDFARLLFLNGASPGERIAVMLQDDLQTVIALLGTIKHAVLRFL